LREALEAIKDCRPCRRQRNLLRRNSAWQLWSARRWNKSLGVNRSMLSAALRLMERATSRASSSWESQETTPNLPNLVERIQWVRVHSDRHVGCTHQQHACISDCGRGKGLLHP